MKRDSGLYAEHLERRSTSTERALVISAFSAEQEVWGWQE